MPARRKDGRERCASSAYRVVDVRKVWRTDISVLEPTESPSVTLITCAGMWLPGVWDYAQRLVVRAELVSGEDAH